MEFAHSLQWNRDLPSYSQAPHLDAAEHWLTTVFFLALDDDHYERGTALMSDPEHFGLFSNGARNPNPDPPILPRGCAAAVTSRRAAAVWLSDSDVKDGVGYFWFSGLVFCAEVPDSLGRKPALANRGMAATNTKQRRRCQHKTLD